MTEIKDMSVNSEGAPFVTLLRQEGLRVLVKSDHIEIMIVPPDGSGPVIERIGFTQIIRARTMIEEEVKFKALQIKRAANE